MNDVKSFLLGKVNFLVRGFVHETDVRHKLQHLFL